MAMDALNRAHAKTLGAGQQDHARLQQEGLSTQLDL